MSSAEYVLEASLLVRFFYNEIQHYQRTLVALYETLRLADEIDALIPGWPLPKTFWTGISDRGACRHQIRQQPLARPLGR